MTDAELMGLVERWKNHQLSPSEIDQLFNALANAEGEKVAGEEILWDLTTGRFSGLEMHADKEKIREQVLKQISRKKITRQL
ncbi:MAG: hypothetical protein ACTHMM_04755 [Agriterribacter sp.]